MLTCIKRSFKTSAKLQSSYQGTASIMRAFIILALAAMAMARPEAGYSYSQPSSSYGAPSGGYSLVGGVGGISGISGISAGRPSAGFGAGGGGSGAGGGFGGVETASFRANANRGADSIIGGVGTGGIAGRANAEAAAGFGSATQIVRNIYVYGPSKDLEPTAGRGAGAAIVPPQKHYKIVFIKAPTPPTPTVPVIPVQQQDEQKTLIYVLVKKPEEAPEINLPTITPTQPSKPEVYFIKYKTQKEVTGGIGPRPRPSYGVPDESGPY
ncbi:PREDICTED: LOW QUALITY PROTEIN: pupal cuticle protein 36-like [Acromyrmex echinatior]|uniref:LOW QUALITY PROTEIN: pupal cuticle protein 36-like n=1 Tax=Acromyrmex echinatior TaxID=103372 RepID=UPI00058108C1|nr:PREDICTED: LOW QUALITY PROTEIN: pupal cuticle protein 36-like [Acromyrmex echinatior]